MGSEIFAATRLMRDPLGDEECPALVETIAFARNARDVLETMFADGAGI